MRTFKLAIIRVFFLSSLLSASFLGAVLADELKGVLQLDNQVRDIPGVGFEYNGEDRLTVEQTQQLFQNAEAERTRQEIEGAKTSRVNCPQQAQAMQTAPVADDKEKKGWEVVFVARISARSEMVQGATTVNNIAGGTNRFVTDLTQIQSMSSAGTLNETSLDRIFTEAGESFNNDPLTAMAYVAEMGRQLDTQYGDSNAGTFINRVEQYGRLAAGQSVGQCSDIHFAMLKAYKQLVGPNAKAYLVNFQTGGDLHHTELIIEHQGQIYTVDYDTITRNPVGALDPLAQSNRGGHGLGYRIFTDEGAEIDQDRMVAYIDSPLGKFLREVSTGRASHNPFENNEYGLFTAGVHHSDGNDIKTFFGELGDGSVIMGVAVNLERTAQLPAGFSLEGHISGSLAYAHRTFRVDDKTASMHSEILYINTGLGVVSPLLELGNFTFQGRTDLVLEAGGWIKQFTDFDGAPGDDSFEGDGNIISRTQARITYSPTENLTITATGTLEVMPGFSTAFPSSTDGSSGADGLVQTLHLVPTRIQGDVDVNYRLPNGIDLFGGLTYQHTPLGGVGEVRAGVGTENLRASAFLRGAFDRDETPIFVPGARREVGASLFYCPPNERNAPTWCVGATGRKSIEDESWGGSLTGELRW